MKTRFLFPHKYRLVGWVLTIPSFILMLLVLHADFRLSFLEYGRKGKFQFDGESFLFNIHRHNFTDEVGSLLLITGLLMIAFSREKEEDERTVKLRLESLLWAVYVNSAWMMFSIIFFYDTLFANIMTYNICTPLILFIARFNFVMYKERRTLKNAGL
ncbi:MAG: hypothetical protein BGO55_24430 [Sphingobacteriales bacterium 50-39]|nr:hypothetical protein [Sphingobacteriales bacterium]OJW58441.1 MAG: hypothetical protein BGO55_24430 [Sphingobacteriales bacterium 50-39]